MKNLNNKELRKRDWILYNFLKDNCVGKDNAMNGKSILIMLNQKHPNLFSIDGNIKKRIKKLRAASVIDRTIDSDPVHGYWLRTSKDEAHRTYKRKLTISYVVNALKTRDISKDELYKIIHETTVNDVVDKQGRLKLSTYQKEEVNLTSDDINFKDRVPCLVCGQMTHPDDLIDTYGLVNGDYGKVCISCYQDGRD